LKLIRRKEQTRVRFPVSAFEQRNLVKQKNGRAGEVFGPKCFRNWWNQACQNLGIQGLNLYGGTRHTTTTEIARNVNSDAARKASGHETNRAFDRYCQIQVSTAFEMAKVTLKKRKKGIVINLGKSNKKR
jgi:cellulase/cellobiase CelA1